jgi:lysozyme family protein
MCNLSPDERFEHCVKHILEHEGGLSQDKRDPGGTTQWGISLRYLRSIGYDVNGDGKVDENDILGLPLKGAKGIYRKYWWNRYRYGEIGELVVVEKVFDMAVNMGGYWAHKLLQIAINRLRDKPIMVDGILGCQTRAAANNTDSKLLREELRKCAEHRYIEIIANNPAMEVFRNGWLKRAAW